MPEKLMDLVKQFLITIIVVGIMFFSAGIYGKAITGVKNNTVDLGRFPANRAQNTIFILTNTGDSVLHITKINSNCTCLTGKLSSQTISPGESAILKVYLRRGSVSGVFKKLISIRSNSSSPLVLTVKGVAEPLIKVTPGPHEYIGHPLPETGYFREFRLVADQDSVVFGIPKVYGSGSKRCKVSLTSIDSRKWKLAVKMGKGRIGELINTTVRLPVKAPEGWQPLVFNFRGRWGYELRAVPSRMKVPVNARDNIVREFEFAILGSKTLDMDKLKLPVKPGVKISWKRLSEDRIKIRVEFDLSLLSFKRGTPLKLKFEYPQSVYGVAVFIPQ